MNSKSLLLIIVGYFLVLLIIAQLTSKNSDSQSFYTGNKQSPWYLVAFGMIGASLSGVTFLSVPGKVGIGQFAYFQIVLGYLVGYFLIATILLPLYYRLNLTSIYTYLSKRFGQSSYKTGAIFFLISRTIGAALRLFLVAGVMQFALFDAMGIPFWVTVAVTILLIYIYTFKGGIKTIVWTDSLQTFFMLLAVGLAIFTIGKELNLTLAELPKAVQESGYAKTFFFDDFSKGNHFFKQFIFGAFVALAMTGLDQDMMQKNLSCKSLKDAQKNMFWFSVVLVVVNLVFLSLGALLWMYAEKNGIAIPDRKDYLFALIAKNHIGGLTAAIFFIGLIAAAYSSADSALTALTTSFCIDILNMNPENSSNHAKRTRFIVHISFALLLFFLILWANMGNNSAVIDKLFKWAGYTYGPLIGLYAFGLFTSIQLEDKWIPIVCIIAPILTFILQDQLKANNFDVGFLLLPINGLLTFLGLFLLQKRHKTLSV